MKIKTSGRKGIKNEFIKYAFEFVILFLAVFMGFIAENYRENLADEARETNYIKNMVRDLKGDKKIISQLIEKNKKMIIAIDTFVKIRNLNFTHIKNTDLFYDLFLEINMWSVGIYTPNEITISQIKATGGFNIVRPKISDLISEFDIKTQHLKWSAMYPTNHAEESFRMIHELTDYPGLDEKPYPPLSIDNKIKLRKFFNLSADLMYTVRDYNDRLNNHLRTIDTLIKILEQDYHLQEGQSK